MSTSPQSVNQAAGWMAGAITALILMAIAGRELSSSLSTWQLLFIRSGIGLLILTPLIIRSDPSQFLCHGFGTQLVRNISHFFGQYCWFFAIASIPLANVFALEFTVPIWCALLAPVILNERQTLQRLLCVLLGFAGILIVLRPGIELVDLASWMMLAGAVGFAVALLTTKKLTHNNSPLTILFYMCLLQLPMSALPAFNSWQSVAGWQWPWVVMVGVSALIAHYCMAKAMQLVDATLVIPMDFLRLPLIAVIGYLLYNEALDIWVMLGAALMLIANYQNIRLEKKRLQSQSNDKSDDDSTVPAS